MSEIFPEKPITSLPEAVAFMGALPMKVGPHLSELERMQLRVDEVERAYTFDTAALKRRIAELEHTVQGMVEGLNGHDCPPPDETPLQAVTRFAVRLMEADRLAVELEALELGDLDGRVSATCSEPSHPTWLRSASDTRGCPWCRIAELETGIAWRDAERDRWSGVHYLIEKAIDKGWSTLDTLDVEAELGPEVAPVLAESVAEPSCLCPPADQPGPHQVGCPLAEVPHLSERPVNELTTVYMPVAAYREDPHDSPLHHDYKGPCRDFPELGGAS